MKWGEKARYLDGEPMGVGRARYADCLAALAVLVLVALIVSWFV